MKLTVIKMIYLYVDIIIEKMKYYKFRRIGLSIMKYMITLMQNYKDKFECKTSTIENLTFDDKC